MYKEPEKKTDQENSGNSMVTPDESNLEKQTPVPDPEHDPYADIESESIDRQDNFVENKEPAELMFCIILASIYAGLARYFWQPEKFQTKAFLFLNFEGFFITVAALALLLGVRPYVSPSSLQVSRHGIKYRGPYWPQRKTVNWSQVVHMYVSPELILIIYRVPNKPRSIRALLIHSVYLADKDKIAESIIKYAPIEPTLVANPGLLTRTAQILMFAAIVIWIFNVLRP